VVAIERYDQPVVTDRKPLRAVRGSRAAVRLQVAGALTLLIVALSAAVGSQGAAAKGPSARLLREQHYVETAVLKAINGPACVREHVAATNTGPPPASLLSILGVLRLPATAADKVPLGITAHQSDVYVKYIRLARTAFGISWYVWVAGPPEAFFPPANESRCLAAQAADFRGELTSIPKALRSATTQMLNAQIRAERTRDAQPPRPPGVELFGLNPGGGGGGGGGADAEVIEQHGSWGGTSGGTGKNPGLTRFNGIVPDGVATVTLHYPAGKVGGFSRRTAPAVTITAHAVNNVVVVSVPRAGAQALRVTTTWRASDGTIIKTIHGGL
jgi:hypothetical protein